MLACNLNNISKLPHKVNPKNPIGTKQRVCSSEFSDRFIQISLQSIVLLRTYRMKISSLPVPIFLLMLVLVQNGESVWLTLPESGVKCVREEIHNNVVVIGEYLVMTFEGRLHSNPTISVTGLHIHTPNCLFPHPSRRLV
ncbi:hypothetical protein Hanom_Chr03g00214151 [Helianthus anomalus]